MGAVVWLASYPKSGNTWMRAFLHNLLRNAMEPMDINALDQFCLGESQGYWYQHVGGKPHQEFSDAEIAALRPKAHGAFVAAHPDSVFVKTHNRMGSWLDVPLVTMEHTAGAIYVVRNPLDLVLSVADHFGQNIDQAIDQLADPDARSVTDAVNVYEIYGTWSQHVQSWTAEQSPGLHVVRYEDLLAKPAQSFRNVARFLGLNPNKDRLERAMRFSSFKSLRAQEDHKGFRERSQHSAKFFRAGTAGQWRKHLSQAQVTRIVNDHRTVMERFRYVP